MHLGIIASAGAVQASLFDETWTGTSDAAWNATRWPQTEIGPTGPVADLSGDEGRLLATGSAAGAGGGGGYNYVTKVANVSVANLDLNVTFRFGVSTGEQYAHLFFRVGGTWTVGKPDLGYNVTLSMSSGGQNRISLERFTGGATRVVLTSVDKGIGYWGTGTWKLRVQAIGSAIRIKTWPQGSNEPGPWDIEVTNSNWLGAGALALSMVNGADATSKSVFWDSLLVGVPQAPAGDPEITSRSPTLYLPLTSASAADSSGNGFDGTFVSGTPSVVSGPIGGNALNLAGSIYVQVAHNAAWEAVAASTSKWVGLEGSILCWVNLPALVDEAWLIHKSGNARGPCEIGVRAMADGSLIVRFHEWHGCRNEFRTVGGVNAPITANSWHLVSVHMDVTGAWATVDGRMLHDGHPHPHGWRGFQTRITNEFWTNTNPIQVGRNPESGALTNVKVAGLAAWFREPVEGNTRVDRNLTRNAASLDLAAVRSIARNSGAAVGDFFWGRDSKTVSTGIQAEMDAMSTAGGGTIFVPSDTYAQAVKPTTNVRLACTSGTATFTSQSSQTAGSSTTLTDPGGTLAIGDFTFPIGSQVIVGDVVRFISRHNVEALYSDDADIQDSGLDHHNFVFCARVVGHTDNGATAIFDRPNRVGDFFRDPAQAASGGTFRDPRRLKIERLRDMASHCSMEGVAVQRSGSDVALWERVADVRMVDFSVLQTGTGTANDVRAMMMRQVYDVYALRGGVDNRARRDTAANTQRQYGLFMRLHASRVSWLDGAFRADGWHSVSNGDNCSFVEVVRFRAQTGREAFGSGSWNRLTIDCHGPGIYFGYFHGRDVEGGVIASGYKFSAENIHFKNVQSNNVDQRTDLVHNDGIGGGLLRRLWLEAGVSSAPAGFIWAGFSGNARGLKDTTWINVQFDTSQGNPPASQFLFYDDNGGLVFTTVTGK